MIDKPNLSKRIVMRNVKDVVSQARFINMFEKVMQKYITSRSVSCFF
jgi:hypothetical protein